MKQASSLLILSCWLRVCSRRLIGRDRHSLIDGDAFWRFGVGAGINSDDFEGGLGGLSRVGIIRASRNADVTGRWEFVKRGVFCIRRKIAAPRIRYSEEIIAYTGHFN